MYVRVLKIVLVAVFLAFLPGAMLAHAEDTFLIQAVPLAQQSQRDTAVPASVTLAQAMWETGHGSHPIGSANNYFGIKAFDAADGSVNVGNIAIGWVWAWTKEWDGKHYLDSRERFRQYRSMQDSFRDHGLLLATSPRYASAMTAVDDPREFARRIAAAGYATSPTYASDLIAVMDARNLYQYDLPRNAFTLVSRSDPLEVNAGEIFQIYFEVKNTGFGTWSPTAGYYLGSKDEERFSAAAQQELGEVVQPERNKRWVITMVAPQKPGTYTTSWEMKHGQQTIGTPLQVQINVRAAAMPQSSLLVGGAFGVAVLGVGGACWYALRQRRKKTLCSIVLRAKG